ncbi:uncharacterized protein SPPG_04344 [Spizellomyces punctatus DAOM BR117]|uniref:Extracellular metalloproteinase n=1 Tax=Spizellomyces punctatus (strain DAOM BR117) TaxID=645134 RepID=A0A0L0HGF6_SPIPD|nr:uncharacterized protein SPPG_04344 [Spizellomyces punctatus DAOM BR117]KNC99994.1 hypothetical protein SPPG_04344 [Spizellomyces punctatus DAOM BR117]|eukprot:XP_016608034.1 hypothetical protein SPPG_04344 [Spizellomyces punctatus DAOM BR117]
MGRKCFLGSGAYLALGLATTALAHPVDHFVRRGNEVGYYQPPASAWKPDGNAPPKFDAKPLAPSDFAGAASNWLSNTFNLTGGAMQSGYQDSHNGLYHYYAAQQVDGLTIVNSNADVHMDSFGNPVMASQAWAPVTKLQRRDQIPGPEISAAQAVEGYAKAFGFPTTASQLTEKKNEDGSFSITGAAFADSAIKADLKLYQTQTSLEKVWSLSVQRPDAWHVAYVSVKDGALIGKANWQTANFWDPPAPAAKAPTARRSIFDNEPVDHTTFMDDLVKLRRRQTGGNATIPDTKYRALPFGSKNVQDTPPVLIANPFNPASSPLGWHDVGDGAGSLPTTVGNNVVAQENRKNAKNPLNNKRPIALDFNFDFPVDLSKEPTTYTDASVTNMFFLSNFFHDTMYKYGFTEAAGNFQATNLGKGGKERDPVVANAQDGSGVNNANFATPPDGQVGVMRMFIFDTSRPSRDGTLDNDVPIHELTHGVSMRLTGGPANSNCLDTLMAGGMGEGWSDFLGVSFGMTAKDNRNTDKPVGQYVTGSPKGVRGIPYSTNQKTNSLTYETLNDPKFAAVHQVGTVWNTMLFEAYWNMVDAKGFTENFQDGPQSGKGNALMIQYVVDGLKLQPCNPDMIQARDAIIAAEKALTKGDNMCLLMTAFAKRGLGATATNQFPFKNSFDVPPECQNGANKAPGAPPGPLTGITAAAAAPPAAPSGLAPTPAAPASSVDVEVIPDAVVDPTTNPDDVLANEANAANDASNA